MPERPAPEPALPAATAALLAALLGGHGVPLPPEVKGALKDSVTSALADALVEALPAVLRRAALPPYLTRQELADLTGWSLRSVDYRRAAGRLPYIKRGARVLFRTEDIEAHLAEGRVEARARRDEA